MRALDLGEVRLLQTMGEDRDIALAARVSTGSVSDDSDKDEKLIRYLWRHKHYSPFEMCEAKFYIKAPLFVARQWMRHRAGSFNEASGRYKTMEPEFYVPTPTNISKQHPTNRQASGGQLDLDKARLAEAHFDTGAHNAYYRYQQLLELGVVREQARMVLPQSLYTEFYWKVDLRNLLGFVSLRDHEGAQAEIQEYAQCVAGYVKEWVPVTYKIFKETENVG